MRTALGIDVSPHQVSAALVERTGREFRVIAAASRDVPASAEQQGSIEQTKALSRVVKSLGRRARSARVKTVVSLSTHPLVMQILDLPRHVPANIREFVEAELKQYVPLSGKRTLCDFCGIGAAAEGRKRMLTAAAEIKPILAIVNACTRTGVVVEAVEPSLLACARAFHARGRGRTRGSSTVIAVLGGDSLTVSLFYDGVMDFVRIRDIPRDVREHDSLCEWLAEELRAVMHYHDTGGDGRGALQARVILQSPAREAKELEVLLRARTGMESLVVTDAHEHFPDSAAGESGATVEVPSQMAVGAAMKALDPDADNLSINLLPEEVRHARLLARHALLTAIAGALTFIGVIVTALFLGRTADAIREQVEQTKITEQLYATPALIAQDKFLDHEISRVRQELGPLQKAVPAGRDVDWPGVLNAVRKAAPAGVCVLELSGDNRSERVSLKGLALSCEAAQSFARDLDQSKPFTSVAMTRMTTKRQNGRSLVEYQLDCSTKPVSGGK